MIIPLNKEVLILPDLEESKTKTGLKLPTTGESQTTGEVVAVSSEVKQIKVGDKVIFRKFGDDFGGDLLEHEGKKYIFRELEEIRGVIK